MKPFIHDKYNKNYPGDDLTENERKQVRKMLDEYEKRAWLMSLSIKVVGWTTALAAGFTLMWDGIKEIAKAIAGS